MEQVVTPTSTATTEVFTSRRDLPVPWQSAASDRWRDQSSTFASWAPRDPTITTTARAETVTSGKSISDDENLHNNPSTRDFDRLSNGGFYPQRMTAEFSRHYVTTLRGYKASASPADFVRPKTTKGARKTARCVSNSIASAQANPYMRSQTYFMKNANIADSTKRMNRYQEAHSAYLSQPKRLVPKFINKTMALDSKPSRRTTFTDKCMAI